MNLWLRLVWAVLRWRGKPKQNIWDVGRRTFRVWPTDLDIFNHMNNGKFLSLLDVARLDLMLRSDSWQTLMHNKWYPVVVAETITFRKSLEPWMLFDVETKIIGWDEISVFIEQRFVVNSEIYTKAIVRIRYLKRERGIVTPAEVIEKCGGWNAPVPVLPEWVKRWDADSALPKGKEPAPSDWA